MKMDVFQFRIIKETYNELSKSWKVKIIPYECVSDNNSMNKLFWLTGTESGMTITLLKGENRGGIAVNGIYVELKPVDIFYQYLVIDGKGEELQCMSINYLDEMYVIIHFFREWVRMYQIVGHSTRDRVFECVTDDDLKFTTDFDEANNRLDRNITLGKRFRPKLYNQGENPTLK